MKNFILLCAIVCCANGCRPKTTNPNEISREGPINLIVGGYGSSDRVSDAQIVDLSSQKRSCNNFPDYPIAMSRATGAMVSGQPIVCGGSSGLPNYYSECYKYTTNSWTPLSKMSTKRSGSASVPVKGKLLVLGGYDGDNRLATSEYVSPDGDASQPGPDLPGPRSSHCAVKLSNGQVMLLGGRPDENLKSAIIFHPETGIDQSLPPLKYERWNFGCATFNSPMHENREVVLAVGGNQQATAEVLDYTQPNPEWREIAGLPTDNVDGWKFDGARAVTSASGQGAIVQHKEHFYELTCEVSGCTWRILPNKLNPGVQWAVMMTLPSDAC